MAVNEALRDLLNAAKPGAALDGLDSEARRKGIKISRNTIAKARRGQLGPNPEESTVQALADLFGVDPRKVREAVGRPPGELGPYEPDPRAASLTQAQRDALDQLIVTIVEQGGQSGWVAPGSSEEPKQKPENVYEMPTAAQTGGRGKSIGQIQQEQHDEAGEEDQDTGDHDDWA